MAFPSASPRSIALTLGLAAANALFAQQLQKTPSRSETTQRLLDIVASPGQFTNTTPPLPAHYAEWTEDQRRVGVRQVAGRCGVLWVMMNDAGPAKLLPPAQDPNDNQELVTGTCIAAHMPSDWTGRPATMADIRRILTRSTELGQPLTLPPSLAK